MRWCGTSVLFKEMPTDPKVRRPPEAAIRSIGYPRSGEAVGDSGAENRGCFAPSQGEGPGGASRSIQRGRVQAYVRLPPMDWGERRERQGCREKGTGEIDLKRIRPVHIGAKLEAAEGKTPWRLWRLHS